MDSTLRARRFVLGDAAALTELLHAAYAELGERGLNFTAVDQSVDVTVRRAQRGQCWVVEDDAARVVGTLTMSLPPSRELQGLTPVAEVADRAWLNQVAVDPLLRRSGIASHLWNLGKEWAWASGATSIGVDTAVPAEHLVALYASWGFRREDTIHWPGKTYDSAVMTLSL